MKTFDDLEFGPMFDGVAAQAMFANKRGVSVVKHFGSYGGPAGKYELAVLDAEGDLDYSTPITDDVEGWLDPADVTELMRRVQELPMASGRAARR